MWQEIKNLYHLGNAFLANVWYGFPSKNLIVVGVTGTDGKTTTTNLIYHILKTSGKDVSMVSTVNAVIDGKAYDTGFHVTTPSPWEVEKFFKKTVDSRHSGKRSASRISMGSSQDGEKKYMVLEVTSHALDQYRVFGIHFALGVITNITHDHLDYHKTYNRYVKAKVKLLENADIAVINRDDESYDFLNSKFKVQNSKLQLKNKKFMTYGLKQGDITPKIFPFKTKLFGEYNKYNILAAVAVCKKLGITDSDIRKGIETFTLPLGRADIVYQKEFTIMVDFAHTPNALKQILSSIKKETKGKVIHVFGCAGERDKTKRSVMGRISSEYSDIIVLTSEDPRSESVEKITNEIELGIMNYELWEEKRKLFKIPNRQEAIDAAIKMAKKGDFVLITGKGHEQSINLGNGEEVWSDYDAVRKVLRK